MMGPIRISVLIVSDSRSSGDNEDVTGKKLCELIEDDKIIQNCSKHLYKIVPDKKEIISDILSRWCDEYLTDVIITSGGTGFSPSDVTPEATEQVIEKKAPGITQAIISGSLAVTPLAMLYRGTAGIRKNTLIINFPGSVKAVKECFTIISPVIKHAVDLIQDHKHEIKETHKIVQEETPQIQMQRKSKVDVTKIALRDRSSKYPMIEVSDAISIIHDEIIPLGTTNIPVSNALNYVVCKDTVSNEASPPFRASIKDGYAVLSADGAGNRKVIGAVIAGEMSSVKLNPGECIRVNTGAPIPDSADAVVQVEDTELIEASSDNTEEKIIDIKKAPTKNQDIRPVGCDLESGIKILDKRTVLKPGELGLLVSAGLLEVSVYRKPKIGLLSTGNELQTNHEMLKPGHIRDSNKVVLTSLFKQTCETVDCGIAKDNADSTLEAIDNALNVCDVLIISGGVSMGDRDVVKQVLTEDLAANIHFARVNMKPGKPTTFATCFKNGVKKYIFALPGNPVSAMVTAQIFVFKALEAFNDIKKTLKESTIPMKSYTVLSNMDMRPEFQRCVINWNNGIPFINPIGKQDSSRLASTLKADCLALVRGTVNKTTTPIGDSTTSPRPKFMRAAKLNNNTNSSIGCNTTSATPVFGTIAMKPNNSTNSSVVSNTTSTNSPFGTFGTNNSLFGCGTTFANPKLETTSTEQKDSTNFVIGSNTSANIKLETTSTEPNLNKFAYTFNSNDNLTLYYDCILLNF